MTFAGFSEEEIQKVLSKYEKSREVPLAGASVPLVSSLYVHVEKLTAFKYSKSN